MVSMFDIAPVLEHASHSFTMCIQRWGRQTILATSLTNMLFMLVALERNAQASKYHTLSTAESASKFPHISWGSMHSG